VSPSAVEVSATADGDMVEVRVGDRGLGIPAAAEAELFHPFFTTKPDGLGLGLSISHSIVTAHGGRLWFTRPPGGGTIFHFTVPAAPGASGEAREV
ncbi:MAG: hybrid sensor histidine kinase/response regulator, partial [Gemmatimonadetes bacterium]|nr:hybrid sensor histidine kinase/response regulator [Gemmatimonadota bacterium]